MTKVSTIDDVLAVSGNVFSRQGSREGGDHGVSDCVNQFFVRFQMLDIRKCTEDRKLKCPGLGPDGWDFFGLKYTCCIGLEPRLKVDKVR